MKDLLPSSLYLNAQLLIFQVGFGVDQYIAQIILEESKRISIEMTKAPPVLDDSKFTAPPVGVEKEEIL
jgi:hypothetical protein